MSEFSQDDLNAFFKQKLEHDAHDSGMWNTPPDFVFDNAMQKINANNSQNSKSRKWLLWFLIPFGIMACFLIQNQLHLNAVHKKLGVMSSTIDAQKKQINQLETELFEKTISATYQKPTSVTAHKQETINLNIQQNSVPNNALAKHTHIKANRPTNKSDSKLNNDQRVESSLNKIKNLSHQLDAKPTIHPSDILYIEPLNTLNYLISNNRLLKRPIIRGIDISRDQPEDESIKYGFLISQNQTSLSLKNALETCELNYYDNMYSGIGLHLIASKTVSKKIEMQFGLGYQVIHNRSEMRQNINYDIDNELEMPNGNMNYYMDLTVETPLGSVSTPASFIVDPINSNDNDIINQVTQTAQHLNVIALHVGPKYSFMKAHDFSFFLNASVAYNRILHYENEITTALKMDDKEMLNYAASPIKINDINKNYMSLQMGLGVEFDISKNTQFVFSANYNSSLNSLRIASKKADPTAYLKQWNTLMGLNVKF